MNEIKQNLARFWFEYGNNGKKHTNGNHKFIQRHVEHVEQGTIWLPQDVKVWKKFYKPTKECQEKILDIVKNYAKERDKALTILNKDKLESINK